MCVPSIRGGKEVLDEVHSIVEWRGFLKVDWAARASAENRIVARPTCRIARSQWVALTTCPNEAARNRHLFFFHIDAVSMSGSNGVI
jgi:hypothetical protein